MEQLVETENDLTFDGRDPASYAEYAQAKAPVMVWASQLTNEIGDELRTSVDTARNLVYQFARQCGYYEATAVTRTSNFQMSNSDGEWVRAHATAYYREHYTR